MHILPDLPVSSFIPQIAEALKKSSSRFLILTAETGAGKSTVIPAGLDDFFQGKIIMTEPRRIAALSISERISEILNEPCGKTCGYKIHMENKISSETKIEVVTEAILSRTLQNDPSLENYSVIILDEFHERSVTTDLNLAFLREAMELRDDLFVLIMSATIETNSLASYLSPESPDSVPVMKIPGRTFPVEVEYKPDSTMVSAISDEIKNTSGKVILSFLPGIKEIRRTENELKNYLPEDILSQTEIHILHSSVSLSEQKKIFSPLPDNTNRVILSSAIAETSLTVPGVTTVIDSGLVRVNRLNVSLGMENLVTEQVNEFSAEQRKGRAGRTQKGRCVRLWNKNEPLVKSLSPEILRTDLNTLVLECACWGKNLFSEQNFFLDNPSFAAIKTSGDFLQNLDFLDSERKITSRGRLALETGVSPRFANVIIFASENPSLKEDAVKFILKYSNYSEAAPKMQERFCDDIRSKIQKISSSNISLKPEKQFSYTELLFSGFPDRLAKKTEKKNQKIFYQFPNGHTAFLSGNLTFTQAPDFLIAPEVLATSSGGTIFSFEPLSESEALSLIKNLLHEETECFFNDDFSKINKFAFTMYGKIRVSEKRLPVSKEDSASVWCSQIHKKGLKSLNLSHKITNFLTRVQFYREHKNGDTCDLYNLLQENPEEWLSPFITNGRLNDEILYNALYWFLEGSVIDTQVPVLIILPNGRKAKVSYELNASSSDKTKLVIRPVIEIIIQRIFGCFENPEILGVPVLLKLLSPASRPLQITDDLSNFWSGTWIEICKEMKGRYPKHNWDYRVAEKE